ncbi:hypothetical protein ACIP5Y_05635 [Nocardia sp. NPDC088792]|uniref:hypothetical protein n=1 Tax=Nocardia sp. NPDC088792 TaxID=3364332 RepID=UPI00382F903E
MPNIAKPRRRTSFQYRRQSAIPALRRRAEIDNSRTDEGRFMTNFSKVVLSASIIGAMTAPTLATAGALPPPDIIDSPAAAFLHYQATIADKSVIVTLDAGSLSVVDGSLQVAAPGGQLVATFPASYQRDHLNYPVATEIRGRTAILTPSVDSSAATPSVQSSIPLHDIGFDPRSLEFDIAVNRFFAQSSLGVAIGGLIGTIIGATVGCIAGGAAVGAAAAVPTVGTLAIPGFLGGCVVTGAALGAIGAVAGTVLVGGPVGLASALLFADSVIQQAAS